MMSVNLAAITLDGFVAAAKRADVE
jgi:hypothetical protein